MAVTVTCSPLTTQSYGTAVVLQSRPEFVMVQVSVAPTAVAASADPSVEPTRSIRLYSNPFALPLGHMRHGPYGVQVSSTSQVYGPSTVRMFSTRSRMVPTGRLAGGLITWTWAPGSSETRRSRNAADAALRSALMEMEGQRNSSQVPIRRRSPAWPGSTSSV